MFAGSEGYAFTLPHPEDPADDGVLEMGDPGDEPVSIGKLIDPLGIVTVEFDFFFTSNGKLEVILDDLVLASLFAPGDGGSSGFTYFKQAYNLADYGLAPGEDMLLLLKLSNPDMPDPALYLDNLLVTTEVPEPDTLGLLALGGLGLLARRRRRR